MPPRLGRSGATWRGRRSCRCRAPGPCRVTQEGCLPAPEPRRWALRPPPRGLPAVPAVPRSSATCPWIHHATFRSQPPESTQPRARRWAFPDPAPCPAPSPRRRPPPGSAKRWSRLPGLGPATGARRPAPTQATRAWALPGPARPGRPGLPEPQRLDRRQLASEPSPAAATPTSAKRADRTPPRFRPRPPRHAWPAPELRCRGSARQRAPLPRSRRQRGPGQSRGPVEARQEAKASPAGRRSRPGRGPSPP